MAAIRDVAIIFLALESLIIGVLLIVLILQILSLTRLLRDEIKPILNSADETVRTVRGTTTFVSDTFVTPMVRISSFAAGVAQALRILTRRRGA